MSSWRNVSAWRDQRSRASLGRATTKQEETLKKSTVVALAIATTTCAAPGSAAAQARLTVEPDQPCYREQSTVSLPGTGFTPNGNVVFTRAGNPIGDPIMANPSGQLEPRLTLPGLRRGQHRLTYVATDSNNSALADEVSLLVTATDVAVLPEGGAPHRLLRIQARGFFRDPARGPNTLYAHVIRKGKPPRTARNLTIGRIKGRCKQVEARKRLFRRGAAPGRYRIQFDTFRRYQPKRPVETEYDVAVFRSGAAARASGLSRAS
jgi:hypothetical protein